MSNKNCLAIAVISGNLVRDVDLKYTANQTAVAHITVAVNRMQRGGEGAVDFFSVTVWGKPAETLEPYLKKGKKVLVHGRLLTRSYENREGQKVTVTEIHCAQFGDIELLGGGERQAQAAPQQRRNDWDPTSADEPKSESHPAPRPQEQGDIPF